MVWKGCSSSDGDVEDLSKKIRDLFEPPELCAQIGREARARVVRDGATTRNAKCFAAVLEEKLGGASRRKELAQAMLY
jgi:hypothetical protein